MEFLNYIVIAAIGALASVLANKGIAVFNDGFRPIVPQYLEGKISRKELGAMSFAISFGLVIGFGIPVSIGASILLVHSILLMTDIIGSWAPEGKKGMIIAGIIGAVYGVGLVLGLQAVVDAFALMPVNFIDSLSKVGAPVVISFSIFILFPFRFNHIFKSFNDFRDILVIHFLKLLILYWTSYRFYPTT